MFLHSCVVPGLRARAQSDSSRPPWTVARQSLLSIGSPRQEYWNGLLFPSPGAFPNPGMKPVSPVSPALAGRFFTAGPPGKPGVWAGKTQKVETA